MYVCKRVLTTKQMMYFLSGKKFCVIIAAYARKDNSKYFVNPI